MDKENDKEIQVLKHHPMPYRKRLIIKVMGKQRWVEKFCDYISRIFPKDKLTFTPILDDKGRHGYQSFCFINIIMDDEDDEIDSGGTE
jgi:hypothetical protein